MQKGVDRKELIRRMTELMRSGAVMLDQACPLCNSPLFRLKDGSLVCPIHGEVKVVKDEREAIEVTTDAVLDMVEKVVSDRLLRTVQELQGNVGNVELLKFIEHYLEIIERIRRIKTLRPKKQGS